MIEEKFKLEGSPCQGYRFMPEAGGPRAVMHVVHGLAEHASRYRPLAEALVADGWGVYAHDQRAHGATVAHHEALGQFAQGEGWSTMIDDVRAFVAHEAQQHPGLPLVLFGHSMGSFVTHDYISSGDVQPLTAVVLSGVAGPPPPIAQVGRLISRVERLRQGRDKSSALLAKMSFGSYNKDFMPARTPFDWLSRDPAEVDKYVEDPRCGFDASNQFWIELLDVLSGLFSAQRLGRIAKDVPIYVFAGDKDPVGQQGTGVRKLVDAFRKAGVSRVDMKLYPGGRHEMLNETNRDEVIKDLKGWLKERAFAAEKV